MSELGLRSEAVRASQGRGRPRKNEIVVAELLDLVAMGLSLRQASSHVKKYRGQSAAPSTILEYAREWSKVISRYLNVLPISLEYSRGLILRLDETVIGVRNAIPDWKREQLRRSGKRARGRMWLWLAQEADSGNVVAWHLTPYYGEKPYKGKKPPDTRGSAQAKAFIEKVRLFLDINYLPRNCLGVPVDERGQLSIITDGLRAYPPALKSILPKATHIKRKREFGRGSRGLPAGLMNKIERLNSTVKSFLKRRRGLCNVDTAESMVRFLITYYNAIRPHERLAGRTPAMVLHGIALDGTKRRLAFRQIENRVKEFRDDWVRAYTFSRSQEAGIERLEKEPWGLEPERPVVRTHG